MTMHQREYTVFIRHREHGLTRSYHVLVNEIQHVEGYGKGDEHIQLKAQEIKLAEQLVETSLKILSPPNIRYFPGESKSAHRI